MFFKPNPPISIHYTMHEFDVFGKQHIAINEGDVFVLECDAETYEAKVIGYGYDNERNVLKMFVTFTGDDVAAIEMLVFSGVLLQKGTQIRIIGDNQRFFQIRVPDEQDVEVLARYLNRMRGITVKQWQGGSRDDPKYRVTPEEIGHPDWHIEFRATTQYGGAASFARITTLVASYPGHVFVMAKNHRTPDEFLHTHASATVFFSICGVNMPPWLCIEALDSIDKK